MSAHRMEISVEAKMADHEPLYRELSKHHPTRGMAVAMGVTCECGYWTGDEQPGKTRPVGVRGDQLDWHRTQVAISFLSAHGDAK